MASLGNQHCANCIGTLSLPTYKQQTKSAKDLTVRSASSTLEWMDPRRSEVSLMKSLGSSRGSQGARSAAWTDTKSTSVSTNTLNTLLCGSKNIRLKISVTFFRSVSLHARHAEHRERGVSGKISAHRSYLFLQLPLTATLPLGDLPLHAPHPFT